MAVQIHGLSKEQREDLYDYLCAASYEDEEWHWDSTEYKIYDDIDGRKRIQELFYISCQTTERTLLTESHKKLLIPCAAIGSKVSLDFLKQPWICLCESASCRPGYEIGRSNLIAESVAIDLGEQIYLYRLAALPVGSILSIRSSQTGAKISVRKDQDEWTVSLTAKFWQHPSYEICNNERYGELYFGKGYYEDWDEF